MSILNSILILLMAYLAVFMEASFDGFRHWFGAQVDLLPCLVVYATLSSNLATMTLLAVFGGLWFDTLSANPLGISILPLFLIGIVIYQRRALILRDQVFAQSVLGLSACAVAPFVTMLMLLSLRRSPLLGWSSLWQWFVMSVTGAMFTPLLFLVFGRLNNALNYKPIGENSFRSDREIRRGRS